MVVWKELRGVGRREFLYKSSVERELKWYTGKEHGADVVLWEDEGCVERVLWLLADNGN